MFPILSTSLSAKYRSVPCTQLTGVWGLIVKGTMHALVPVYDQANGLNSLYIACQLQACFIHIECSYAL